MIGVLRRSARNAGWQQVRSMSSKVSREEEIKEMYKWRVSFRKLISIVAIPICIGKAVYDLSQSHDHGSHEPEYPYLRIRNKDFPWGPDGLFERKHEEH